MTLFKSVACWLLVLSCFVCIGDYVGSGLANLWIRLTPPISVLSHLDFFRFAMFDYGNTTKWPGSSALLPVTFITYLAFVVVYGLVGWGMDHLVRHWRRLRSL
jgi:hypothetical protein